MKKRCIAEVSIGSNGEGAFQAVWMLRKVLQEGDWTVASGGIVRYRRAM